MTAYRETDRDAEVLAHVIGILEEITSDWDVDAISPDSLLADLNLESINLVYFIAELQQTYGLQQRLLTRIRAADQHLTRLRVADVVQLVQELRCAQEEARGEPNS